MEHKFTTDGKKVAIVGKLNAQETIVQEIFVTESGAEIPQGENFVVRSLLDEPAKSWKAKCLEEEERNYQTKKGQWEREIDNLRKRQTQLIEDLKNKVSSLKKMNEHLTAESLDPVFNFLTNQYTHVVANDYGQCDIIEMDKFHKGNEYGLKLVSIYGDDKGDLNFRLNEYRDGSGSWTGFTPFKSYDEALQFISGILNAKEKVDNRDIEKAKKYGIKLDPAKVEAARILALEYHEKNIQKYKDYIREQEAEVVKTNEKFKL